MLSPLFPLLSLSLHLSFCPLPLSPNLYFIPPLLPTLATDNGPEHEGLIIPENLPYLTQCPVTVSEMDLVSPPLVAAAIWSWAPGFSR